MKNSYSPKERMLNAYRGVFSDRYPVAPEFWYYYPAKILGVGMVEFQREIPHWQALRETFRKYGTEGWGIVSPGAADPRVKSTGRFTKREDGRYLLESETVFQNHVFASAELFSDEEPSWCVKHMVDDFRDLPAYLDMVFNLDKEVDFAAANRAYAAVGEDYLLELNIGVQFFDVFAGAMGFEKAIEYFYDEDEAVLMRYREQYEEYQLHLIDMACVCSPFESFFIGCSSSCNSLLGPVLWRKYDKPGVKKIAARLHERGRLLHLHFHGRCMESVSDFYDIGVDCVCPFERGPGGDIDNPDDLKKVRCLLGDKVTFNGNIHTVETLIRGTPADAVREVSELKQAFFGSPRLIIGTGDQVGKDTKEENLLAMIDEAKRH